jgi:type I restriction enzyme M protein
MPLEAETRVLIDNNLTNLGWQLTGRDKNVFFEQPRTEAERRKLGGKRPDYVLYSKGSDKPLIVIEAKKKGVRIDTALEQGINYARAIEAPLVFATDGVFCKTFHTVANRPPVLNGEEIDEFIREALALRYLTSFEVNTVSPKVQYDRKELIRIFDEANNMLRGDGLRAGIERFGEFANILFLKLVSENEQIKQESGISSKFDIASCSWDSIKNIAPSARIEYINNTVYKRLNDLYKTEIFTSLTIRDETILKEIMDKLDPLMLTDVDSDVKGDAFEYFLKASTSTKNDLGEYFTPRHIVKTMVRLVNPQIGEKIYDPFCGTGGFLIETFRHIERNMVSGNPELQRMLREETIYGNEITNTARITKMNMILAGDGHSNIHMRDSLANPVYIDKIIRDGKGKICRDGHDKIKLSDDNYDGYDVVITNMPYSQKTKYGNLYDIPSTNGDSICVQHCIRAINSLSENGRMALVVPEGFLFRKDLAKTREYLLERCQLQSIISLPQGVFLPYTGVKTDIIYATKVNKKVKVSDKKKDYWYFNVKSDGYSLDNHRRKLDIPSDLSKYEEYRKLDKDQTVDMMKVGFEIIPLDKVRNNSFILVGSRYRTSKMETTAYPMVSLGDEHYFSICSGGTPSSTNPEYWNGNIHWITLADLPAGDFVTDIEKTERTISEEGLNNSNAKLLPVNSVVVSTRATIGRIGIARTELATNQGFKNIIIKNQSVILPEYLAFILTAKRDEMINLASGATFKEISKENFCSIQIPLPPLENQEKLVVELENYEKIIQHAQGLILTYIPSIHISERWNTAKIRDLFVSSSEIVDPQQQSGIVNYIGLENIESETGKIVGNIESDIQAIKSTKRVFRNGDVLFGKLRPALNKVAFVPYDGICSTDIIVLHPISAEVMSEFYSIIMRNNDFKTLVLNGVSGGQLPRVDVNYLLDLPIPEVPIKEQQTIVTQIREEQNLIKPSERIISIFVEKIKHRIEVEWGK